jgi:anti-anti-sigma factor
VALSVETHEHGDITVLTMVGDLDLAAVPGFEAELLTLISAGRFRLVIDLEKLTFCDSTGLSAFVRGDASCAAGGGWLRLAAPSGSVLRALEITGLLGSLTFDSVDGARDGGNDHPPLL